MKDRTFRSSRMLPDHTCSWPRTMLRYCVSNRLQALLLLSGLSILVSTIAIAQGTKPVQTTEAGTVPTTALSTVNPMPVKQTVVRRIIKLSSPVTELLPGFPNKIMLYTANGDELETRLQMLDLVIGEVVNRGTFPEAVNSVAPYYSEGGYYRLLVAGDSGLMELRQNNDGQFSRSEYSFLDSPIRLNSASANYVFPQTRDLLPWPWIALWGETNEEFELAIGRDFDRGETLKQYQWQIVNLKEPLSSLINVNTGSGMLNLDLQNSQATLIDTRNGAIIDSIYIDGINAKSSEAPDIQVPSVEFGGSGNVLIINDDLLTILSLNTRRSRPLANPIQIPLQNFGSLGDSRGSRTVVANRDLSHILIGTANSEKLVLLQSFKGGVEFSDEYQLPFAISDMAMAIGESASSAETLVFLSDDGTQILVLPLSELASLKQPNQSLATFGNARTAQDNIKLASLQTDSKTISSASDLDLANIREVQIALARLSYKVGAIDGIFGNVSRSALRAFQIDNNLPATGRADASTRQQLIAGLQTLNIGKYHALIASYPDSEKGCNAAREDVTEFAGLLAGTELAGREIYIVVIQSSGKRISSNYAVTIDAGTAVDDSRLAADIVRSVSARSADGQTGADSFVQKNPGTWSIQPGCNHVVQIE